ncbi:MAG: PKD domain-containing protein [Woeseiaceae bacterium]|nr:PKD domain-containing protein [Woeseiaceae bacterium]
MKGIRVVSAVALFVLSFIFDTQVTFAQNSVNAVPAQGHPGSRGLDKAAQMSKAGMRLRRAHAEYRAHINRQRAAPFVPGDSFLPFAGGRVLVEARATTDPARLLADLRRLGLTASSSYSELVSGYLPVAAIEDAAALPSLRAISAAIAPIRSAGSINSQGDVALQATVARTTYGVDGSGIKVGVLSDSYDDLGGAAADIASGDLPAAGVQVLAESTACGALLFCIDEGRAMLQIIFDMAPGADLLFHTGLQTKAEYANGITALAAAGADVIVDDLLYLHEPMFQDGIVAQAVDTVVAGGAIYYSAAGNAGDESYESGFNDTDNILCIEFFLPIGDCDPQFERVGRMHDFDPGPGEDLVLTVTVPVNGVLTVAMQWDQPFGGPGPLTDHDLVLLSPDGGLYYDISANDNVTMGEGWEVLQFQNSEFLYNGETQFGLVITYDEVDSIGPPANLVKLVVFGSGNTLDEWRTDSSTVYGHANAAGASAVAAAWWQETPAFGVDPAQLEPYSSKGGTPIYFTSTGAALATAEMRLKPEIAAVDGVDTTFFFSDPDGDGIDNFFGTSAAAPHAAGVAALLLEADPGATPAQVNSALESTALDMAAPGFDFESGYGLIQADAAIAAMQAGGGNIPPLAGFTTDISGRQVAFTDTSTDNDGAITSWSWDFGDGNGADVQHPTHTYAADSTYTVTLTVMDDDGAPDSMSQQVTVAAGGANAPPIANFSYSCNARDCSFDSSASSDDAAITRYAWDFGDGNGSAAANPLHSYASQGNYTVTLTVFDIENQSDAASASFRVKNRGNASGSTGGDGGDGGTTTEKEKGRRKCSDGIDNDGDGLIDGADPDCA